MGIFGRRGPSRRSSRPPAGVLADLAAAPTVPADTPLAEVELLAMDLEATGLDPRRHEMLAIGMVPVRGRQILLAGARHLPVRPRGDVGQSATLHGLTDDDLATAAPVEEVLPQVLAAFLPEAPSTSTGTAIPPVHPHRRVLLAHFAQVETTFLAAASREVLGGTVGLQVVDTMEVERRLVLRTPVQELREGRVRLDACRRRRGLPRYRAHSALTDALACAELFLAQCAELEELWGRPPTLGDLAERRLR